MDLLRRKSAETRIAVVGASNAPHKYGNIITKNLLGKGYTVLPVNLREESIAGLPVTAHVSDLSPTPDLVVIVTPPASTRAVLRELADATPPAPPVWLQDGSFDAGILASLEGAPHETVHGACVMVVSATAR